MSRLVICGSTDWDVIGRKKSSTDYPTPVIYAQASDLKLKAAITSNSSVHSVLIDGKPIFKFMPEEGVAYTFGRNDKGQLGHSKASTCDLFKVELDEKVVHAATGRGHTLLVTESGAIYSAGDNKAYQCGYAKDSSGFVKVDIKDHFVKVAAGIDFSLGLTKEGKVWSWGNPQYGQLGHGSDEQYIGKGNKVVFEPQLPQLIKKLDGKRITDIQCGSNHSLVVDNTGSIYVWGCAGLGLNETPPRDVMVPTEVPGFKNRNNYVKKIACGPTCCMVTDSRDALFVWGKWKNSGDGGQGTPWLYPRHFDGLSGWKIDDIACGGVSLFVISEKSTISWGQGAGNGELGHGEGKPRSATNAVKVDALEGIHANSVSCGLGTTLILINSTDPLLSSLGHSEGSPTEFTSSPKKRKPQEAAELKTNKKKK